MHSTLVATVLAVLALATLCVGGTRSVLHSNIAARKDVNGTSESTLRVFCFVDSVTIAACASLSITRSTGIHARTLASLLLDKKRKFFQAGVGCRCLRRDTNIEPHKLKPQVSSWMLTTEAIAWLEMCGITMRWSTDSASRTTAVRRAIRVAHRPTTLSIFGHHQISPRGPL